MMVAPSDLFAFLEWSMASIAHQLLVKYGLGRNPTEEEVQRWLASVKRYRNEGYRLEEAGESAAKTTFRDYRTRVYASEADTIEMLLQEAGK